MKEKAWRAGMAAWRDRQMSGTRPTTCVTACRGHEK